MKWELLRPGGNSPVTVFAGDDELLAFLDHEPHGRIVMTGIIAAMSHRDFSFFDGYNVSFEDRKMKVKKIAGNWEAGEV